MCQGFPEDLAGLGQGGTKQLAQDAIGLTSDPDPGAHRACPADTAVGVLAWFIDLWRQWVLVQGGSSGCPLAAIALPAPPKT